MESNINIITKVIPYVMLKTLNDNCDDLFPNITELRAGILSGLAMSYRGARFDTPKGAFDTDEAVRDILKVIMRMEVIEVNLIDYTSSIAAAVLLHNARRGEKMLSLEESMELIVRVVSAAYCSLASPPYEPDFAFIEMLTNETCLQIDQHVKDILSLKKEK